MATDNTHGKWYGTWSAYLAALLEERKLNPSDFAVLVGDRQNNVWQYLKGVIRPPLAKLELWSRRLKLDEAERTRFIRLGRLGHAPKEVREEIDRLRNALAASRAEHDALRQLLTEHGIDTSGVLSDRTSI